MQFMVISDPQPARPSQVRGIQTTFWDWLDRQKEAGIVKAVYVKTGRGAIVVFDVESHETLHRLMTEWSDCVPAAFTVFPLIDPAHQEAIARKGA
ncbi:DUF3303 family protein [Parvibaculum sp.]|jgi:hypothetical protein|uniref:DUF3303 family protein n=1 Tax=Parvibaculum sp. TaxID=2024848 RepID=UPI001DAB0F14|nr:DUF3303 family protein [Parvibaculum sp.]MBX3491239.1 hypothetical protein [Parvibaculum sp.]MBX3491263.1 hypothetical protein [Parvibaculum sp.]